MWLPSEHDPIIVPKFKKKKIGYYSFKMRSEEGEIRSRRPYGTVPRLGGTMKCSTYGGYGHNKKMCKHKVLLIINVFILHITVILALFK